MLSQPSALLLADLQLLRMPEIHLLDLTGMKSDAVELASFRCLVRGVGLAVS